MIAAVSSSVTDTDRLPAAKRLLASQQSLAATLGDQSPRNIPLELLLDLFIARQANSEALVKDALGRFGPWPAVTRRWLLALSEDRMITVVGDWREGTLALTDGGLTKVRTARDLVQSFS